MKRSIVALIMSLALAASMAGTARAVPKAIESAVLKEYPPAIMNKGLETAYVEPDPSKFKGFVVVEHGGIPAERARHFITWSDYDYRGVVVHVGADDEITTRRGSPYTYLKRGDVMAVAGVKYFHNTVYVKLISPEVYVPQNRMRDKRHSRVTVMLGFKFQKDVIRSDDTGRILTTMNGWIRPFPDLSSAKAYAMGLAAKPEYAAVKEGPEPGGAEPAAATTPPAAPAEDEKMRSLEDKIDQARRNIEEAEKELKDLKESK